jgi:hypothetical protein
LKRTILTVVLSLMAGAALATSYSDLGTAERLQKELANLQAMDALTGAQIATVRCMAQTIGVPNQRPVLAVNVGDTGRAGLLSALDTVIAGKITAVKAQLEALGVTNVP